MAVVWAVVEPGLLTSVVALGTSRRDYTSLRHCRWHVTQYHHLHLHPTPQVPLRSWWKSKPTWKLKHANPILETFEYFCQISSKSIHIISSYTGSKLGHFLRHSVELLWIKKGSFITVCKKISTQDEMKLNEMQMCKRTRKREPWVSDTWRRRSDQVEGESRHPRPAACKERWRRRSHVSSTAERRTATADSWGRCSLTTSTDTTWCTLPHQTTTSPPFSHHCRRLGLLIQQWNHTVLNKAHARHATKSNNFIASSHNILLWIMFR